MTLDLNELVTDQDDVEEPVVFEPPDIPSENDIIKAKRQADLFVGALNNGKEKTFFPREWRRVFGNNEGLLVAFVRQSLSKGASVQQIKDYLISLNNKKITKFANMKLYSSKTS